MIVIFDSLDLLAHLVAIQTHDQLSVQAWGLIWSEINPYSELNDSSLVQIRNHIMEELRTSVT